MKKLLKEIGTILIAVISVAMVYPYAWVGFAPISILTVGFIYNFSKPFYDYRKRPVKVRMIRLFWFITQLLYQLWVVIKYIFLMIGYFVDLFGNVLLGELIEDLVTSEEKTYFGQGDVTISASIGDLERRGKLNNTGMYISRILTKLDPTSKQHCIDAVKLYNYKKRLKQG